MKTKEEVLKVFEADEVHSVDCSVIKSCLLVSNSELHHRSKTLCSA